jgi:uncharacterized protein GlcG (DUF336 family)
VYDPRGWVERSAYVRNVEVVSAFLDKKAEGVVPISSDGATLYSYGVPIAIWGKRGAVTMPESSKFYSRTTSRHRHMVEDMAVQKGIDILKIG